MSSSRSARLTEESREAEIDRIRRGDAVFNIDGFIVEALDNNNMPILLNLKSNSDGTSDIRFFLEEEQMEQLEKTKTSNGLLGLDDIRSSSLNMLRQLSKRCA